MFDQTIEGRTVATMAALPEADVARRFAYHPPRRAGVADLHEHVRDECAVLAQELNRVLPGCPEAWKALDAIDLACMHANAAIARHYNDSGLPVPPADADHVTAQVAQFLAAEQQDGETVGDVWARLIDELKRYREKAVEQMAFPPFIRLRRPETSPVFTYQASTPEPDDGATLADGGDVWARRDNWLPVGMGAKTSPEQRWYSLNIGGPMTWEDVWARRSDEGCATGDTLRLMATVTDSEAR